MGRNRTATISRGQIVFSVTDETLHPHKPSQQQAPKETPAKDRSKSSSAHDANVIDLGRTRADDRLSDMANLSRAKDAALGAAIRDLAWDTANSPRKAQQIGGVFSATSPPMRPIGPPATTLATACLSQR
jgi:hypothetical protein